MNITAGKLVAGAAALAGTAMAGVGIMNAEGGNRNGDSAKDVRGALDGERQAFVRHGARVPEDLLQATDRSLDAYEGEAKTHRQAGYTTLAAGVTAAVAGVGSLLARGSSANVLRGIAGGSALGAGVAALAGWKTWSGLDEATDRISTARNAEATAGFETTGSTAKPTGSLGAS